jgi:hypothetical protein
VGPRAVLDAVVKRKIPSPRRESNRRTPIIHVCICPYSESDESSLRLPTLPTVILFSHLRLGLPSDHIPSGFPNKILYTFLISPIRAVCTAHLIIIIIIMLIMFSVQT